MTLVNSPFRLFCRDADSPVYKLVLVEYHQRPPDDYDDDDDDGDLMMIPSLGLGRTCSVASFKKCSNIRKTHKYGKCL